MKYRYIAIRITPEANIVISEDSYKNIIYDTVFEHYGLKSAIHLNNLQVIDVLSASNLCVFKVQRSIYRNVCDALESCKKLRKIKVAVEVLSVSGSVKGIRKKVLVKLNSGMVTE